MKRLGVGRYTEGKWYAVRDESGWWYVGIDTLHGSEFVQQFRLLREARSYIQDQIRMTNKKEKG